LGLFLFAAPLLGASEFCQLLDPDTCTLVGKMVKGHVTYYLSPMHQKFFTGVMSKTLKNFTAKVANVLFQRIY
jgi:hypothetical protein